MKKSYKKIFIILTFVLITVITYAFSIYKNKTEIPKLQIEEIKPTSEKIPEVELKPEIKTKEFYKITDRSTIIPVDKTNKKKILLLTIDDGPSKRTKDMIEILNKHNAKAIFFINGMHDKANEGVIKYIYDEGYALGNHTWDHPYLKKLKDETIIKKDIDKNSDLILKLTGSLPHFFRAPYGESTIQIRDYIKEKKMISMNWSGAAKDWEKSTVNKDIFISNVTKDLHSGSIILIHEHPWSLANLDALLTTLESDGYTYVDPKDIIE